MHSAKIHNIRSESLTIGTRFSGSHSREFGRVGLAGREQGGDDGAAFGREVVAVAGDAVA